MRTAQKALRASAVLLACAGDAWGQPPQVPGTAESASPYRVLRSTSGTQGEVRNGRYVVLDPRDHFQVPQDAQIIVHFSWLGPPGPHRLAGTWRGPKNTSTTTEFDYTAMDRQFGAYWVLKLPPDVPSGAWSLEAHIDGYPAGVHAFEISAAGEAPPPITTPRRVPLTPPELFQRGVSALVTVDALDAGGTRLDTGLGVRLEDGTVLTTFAAVNGASVVRVSAGDGGDAETREVAGLSYRNGWALLKLPVPAPGAGLKRAEVPDIGLPCFSFEAPGQGTHAIVRGEISGTSEVPGLGPRVSVTFNNAVTAGAPVLNEFGEIIGIIPSGAAGDSRFAMSAVYLRNLPALSDGTILPIAAVRPLAEGTMALDDVARRGLFVPRLTAENEVLSGGFSVGVQRAGARTQPIDQRAEFSRRDSSVTAFVTWDPKRKFKGTTAARIYDQDNRLLGETKPAKLSLRPGDLVFTSWQFSVPKAAGLFRVDVLLGEAVAWRGHFRVTD